MNEILDITIRSVAVSGAAVLLALIWSLPTAYIAAVKSRMRILIPIAESLSGIPTVLIGLLLYLLLSRSGPLGFLNLLYTTYAISIGQAILVTPLIIATTFSDLRKAYENIGELLLTLGASRTQIMLAVFKESLNRITASAMLAFSRALGELGVALMIGGNIKWQTRVFTTAIALSVSMGEFEQAIYLGIILLVIETLIIVGIRVLQGLEK